MGDQIKLALGEIATRQARLNDLDTAISLAIRDVEERLRDHVSTRIAIVVRLANRDEATLVFGKHDGKWCLAFETGGQRVPLVSTPREVRAGVFAGGYLAQLIYEAVAQVDEQIAERELAVRAAHDLVDAMGGHRVKERRRG